MKNNFDLIVIGAGPGGYVAAIKAAQLGLSVACIDENDQLGGTCLRVGCIPSKALLESSERYESLAHDLDQHGLSVDNIQLNLDKILARKDKTVKTLTGGIASLFKKNKVTRINGRARLAGSASDLKIEVTGKDAGTYTASHTILATGSVPASLPNIDFADPLIDSSTEALAYDDVPKHLAIIGAGYIGLELGSVWRRLGSKVTVIEYLDRVLPGLDGELAKEAQKLLTKQGLELKLGCKVTAAKSKAKGKGVSIEIEGQDAVEADRLLVCVGRKPNTQNLGLEELGVSMTQRGHVEVNSHFQTNIPNLYAIGDVIPTAALAHVAEDEGVACVEAIISQGKIGHVDYEAIPAVVYTHPEIAGVGLTEESIKEKGIDYKTGKFPFLANGRAKALGDTTGFVKVLTNKQTDRVLGVHIIGPRAGDLIAECATAMHFKASAEDIARACHAHPTLSETVKEAAMAAYDLPIHI